MEFDIRIIFKQMIEMYKRLDAVQKIAIPVLVVFSITAIVLISRWASRPEYAVLYSNLHESSAASVVQQLKEKKVGYELKDNGSTVMVTPPTAIDELRLDLAANGIPVGNVGFEVFKESSFGRTGFVERMMSLQALQGELERTISSISVVQQVRVHITRPDRSVFVTRDIQPTASVLLTLKPETSLDKKQIKGIANLVASAVEGLTIENITLVDSQGNQLVYQEENEEEGTSLSRLEYQKKMEQTYEKRIETMLSGVLGQGKAIARVTADLDFDKVEKEEELYDPAGKVTRSERTLIDKMPGGEEVGGVAGVMSNLSNQKGLLASPDSMEGVGRKESVINYEVSRSVSRIVAQQGKLSRLSVAVLVDGNYVPAVGGEAGTQEYQPLSAEMVKQIEGLVKQSVGFDSTRGDIVTVENIRFADPAFQMLAGGGVAGGANGAAGSGFAASGNILDLTAADLTNKDFLLKAGDYVVPLIIAVLFFIFMVRPMVKTLLDKSSEVDSDLNRLLPAGIKELEAELESERRKLTTPVVVEDEAIVDMEELEGLIASNARMAKDNPRQAALLIRHWINEGK